MDARLFIIAIAISVVVGVCLGVNQPHDLDEGIYIDEIEYKDCAYEYDTNVGINFTSTTKYNIGDRVMIVKQAKN